jgi:hypothetical protein
MKINIVLPIKDNWIFQDIANNLKKELKKNNFVEISKYPKKNFDVYHHISYLNCNYKKIFLNKVNTTLVTHVDSVNKFIILLKLNKYIDNFIIQSKDTLRKLEKYINKNKLKVIYLPGNDLVPVKKINLGYFANKYSDGRKNENILENALNKLNPNFFRLTIIGNSWKKNIARYKKLGFEVNYIKKFNIKKYIKIIEGIDYLIYLGFDEGSLSFMDALRAGIKTIATHQGFQKDFQKYNNHKINNIHLDFERIIIKIQKEIENKVNFSKKFTYKYLAQKHLETWNAIKKSKKNLKHLKIKKKFIPINLITNTFKQRLNILKNK